MTDTSHVVLHDEVDRDGYTYRRLVARTPWIKPGDDLADVIRESLGAELRSGGTVFLAEKVAIVASDRLVPVSTVKVSRFAVFASKYVRPIGQDLAQSIPERMQFVIDRIGLPRTMLACAAAAVTRPLKVRGAFYVIAGREARDLDGMHGEYADWLLPPLKPREGRDIVNDLANRLSVPVAIADVNDRGGHIRAVSDGGLSPDHLLRALKDNPHGHKATSTPIGMVQLIGKASPAA
jgi:F420-0:gamma-glutamyl ligase